MRAPAFPDVTIVGGGIVGCALAWELTRHGIRVDIVERREIAREASWASAGIISPPGPRHGSRAEMALMAFRRYPSLIAEIEDITGQSVGHVATGEVDLGTSAQESAMRDLMAWQRAHGVESEWLDTAQVHEHEPAVHQRFSCGIYVPQAGSVLLGRMAEALARAACMRGATIHEHTLVTGISVERGTATGVQTVDGVRPAGAIVIAAGAWSRMLGESIDLAIPTVPVRGQMMAIAEPPIPLRSVVSGPGGYLVPRADGTVAVGATEEHDAGFDASVTPAGLRELVDLAAGIAPSLVRGRLAATWAGLRPGTADGEVIIGRVPHLDNVWIATGHFRSGALLAPSTAELLAASIVHGTTDARLAPFAPGRP